MKFSRKAFARTALVLGALVAGVLAARAAMPAWIQNIEARSIAEAALFRAVSLPSGPLTIRRPPAESVPALADLVKQHPQQAELYSIKALEEEQKLDFAAAEADWKLYLHNATDKAEAQLALADFYQRRHRPLDEVSALSALAKMPSPPSERFTPVDAQRSWNAFERIFQVIDAQALGRAVAEEQYDSWIARYPEERGLYGSYFEYLLGEKDFKAAAGLVTRYQAKFSADEVFPIKARALLAYKQGSLEQGLAVYDKAFQPLWPAELIKNYFDLLNETRSRRKFLDQARAALARNPGDLNAVARIFYYYQQQGNLPAAQQAITDFRLKKDARKAPWTPQELYTFARLLEEVHLYPESARYYYALYSNPRSDAAAQEKALASLAGLLLTAPEQQLRLGAGNISLYKDIATMDPGPGYLNGILSLLLNTADPSRQYVEEQQRAQPYFHRSRAAELLAFFDQRFPSSAARPDLHARLITAYAGYGLDGPVIRLGGAFLNSFPAALQRNQVALLMADAYVRTNNTKEEFAIYDAMLRELARKAEGVPLGESSYDSPSPARYQREEADAEQMDQGEGEGEEGERQPVQRRRPGRQSQAFAVSKAPAARPAGVRSPEYQQVLDRYISRLTVLKRIPEALVVWRQELDRNPSDPGLYERFAEFLSSNRLGTEQEAVYKRAIQQFQGGNWYNKLARWYLAQKRDRDFEQLSQQLLKIFSGSQVEAYLSDVSGMPQQLGLQFNLFAHDRFPHNLAFVRNLIDLYQTKQFWNPAARDALLRSYWFADEQFRSQYFEELSRTGKLESELNALRAPAGKNDWSAEAKANPGSARFVAEAELWRSHFEAAAPVIAAVAQHYPADPEIAGRAASVFRSLAYFDPKDTEIAVRIQSDLLKAAPADSALLARIGDIYSDREQFDRAAPYWNRIPETAPGKAQSYEEAATVFWDYYFFDDALRLLNLGRTRLKDDTLYSYQIGAIYENKRDYARAVDEYLKGALAQGATSPSQIRVLQLAARKSTRDLVDAATAKAVINTGYDLPAVELRVAVLEAQSRKPDLAAFLNTALDGSNALEVLERIENLAQQKSLESVRQHALERQAAITTDPIRRLELRYALVRFYEQKKDLASAQKNLETLYRENPKVMGVVRSTVDFYWRNKLEQRAIDTLLQAAKDAYPALRTQFTYEASRKMIAAAQYRPAREALAGLLSGDPYNAEYLAAMADAYARAGDQSGLRDFYLEKIKAFAQAPLPAEERKDRIAALRRGLVPALTAIKDYAGAVDQYIEIINAFPDDSTLTTEAALYAQRCQRSPQLLNFYSKTVAASPQDSRWAMVLARVQTNYEDFDSAIKTYSQAVRVRPDRADLIAARAALEERLLRFDEAAADYSKLYDLEYHNAKWMEKVAEIRARQGRPELAVAALNAALVEGRPESSAKYSAVAERLENWGMLAEARLYVEKAVNAAGDDLLAGSENHAAAQTYTRIMTRLRQQEAAYQKLQAALGRAGKLPPLAQQIARNGLQAITNTELRQSQLRSRDNNARSGMAACMREMGTAAARYFTPEEKLALQKSLEQKNSSMGRPEAYAFLLPLAQKAGLPELQANLMYERLLARGREYAPAQELESLQTRRLKLVEVGHQLEKIADVQVRGMPWSGQDYLRRAADIYHLAGSDDDELRVLNTQRIGPQQQERYFELLLAKDPQRLVNYANQTAEFADAKANFVVARGDLKLALAAVDALGSSESQAWKHAYTGLVGLYFAEGSQQIQNAFTTALGDGTIGQQLDKKIDRTQTLAGDIWFYYGSRYGEYLGLTHKGDPEDFVAADVEHTPLQAAAYFSTALYYEDSGDLPRAIADYLHVRELDPKRIDVSNRLAGIYWKQKRNDDALREWKRALDTLKSQAGSNVPQTFWGDYAATMNNLVSRKLLAQFQPDMQEILRVYAKNEGEYRLIELLRNSHLESSSATSLALDLSSGAEWRSRFLDALLTAKPALPLDPEPVYRALLDSAQGEVQKSEGASRELAQSELEKFETRWLHYLLKTRQYDRAREELSKLPPVTPEPVALVLLQIKLAAQTGGLDRVIGNYRGDVDHAPANETLRRAAKDLEAAGDKQSARKLLEFVFTREIENHNLTAANMLGLAEIRIQAGDLEGGLALLRRLTLVVGNPFESQDPAAALLVRTGHPAEAIAFLEELAKAQPWNADARVRLAQARIAAAQNAEAARKELAAVVSSGAVSYDVRLNAARSLAGTEAVADLGSRELNLIAGGKPIAPADANQPYFFAARLSAAERQPAGQKVPLLRSALEDSPFADSARLPLLRAANEAADFHLAVAAMNPVLTGRFVSAMERRLNLQEEDEASGEESAPEAPEAEADAAEAAESSAIALPQKDAAEISRLVGHAFNKTGDLDAALSYLRRAYRLETDAALKSQINKEVQQVRAVQRRRTVNRARQPVISSRLDQEHVVHPRIAEPAPPAPKKPATPTKGGAL